jgi:molecular chaperone GrpE
MIDRPNDAAPAITLESLSARLEELTREVRRQGRAAVAAQAAAESCLDKLSASDAREDREDGEPEGQAAGAAADDWVRALLPVADALDRVVAQATAVAERGPRSEPPRRGLLSLLSRGREAPEPGRDADLRALAEGLRVLRAQLAAALASQGVEADRRVGVPIDPEVHRVVEARPARAGEREGVVLEVVRPGYAAGGRVLREAEVVAAVSPATSGSAR